LSLLKSEILKDRPLVVSIGKAKVLLDCSRDRIYSFIKSGELESYVEGTRRKITMDSIERLIAGRLAANGREFRRCHQRPPIPTEETRRKIAATKKRQFALRREAAA